ncbi:hypothetical protein ACFXPR_09950 [Nocardia tengchongensis]
MTHNDDRIDAGTEPEASPEPVHTGPTGRLTCEVRVLAAHEETK